MVPDLTLPTRSMNASFLKRRILARFDLRHDQAEHEEIDAMFRSGVEFRGTNLWVLIFAILVASIGLNINSTAVIIGAMLISPLMGPIMALGYGAGINDSQLIRSSLFNLGLAALLSLIASTAYFLVTPLSQAHSEVLARTTPTIWDVMIALLGGLSGVIGATRRIKSNLVPGVAIATALMPPLCTAGYGLAVGNWSFFFGAFYLFTINCVFIAIATLMMVRLMRLPSVKMLGDRSITKRRTLIGVVVLLTVAPSLYLALDLVRKEVFESNSARYVNTILSDRPGTLAISVQPDHRTRTLRVNLAGERVADTDLASMRARLAEFGLAGAALLVSQSGQSMPDMNAIKTDLLRDLLQNNQGILREKDAQIASLQAEIQLLRSATSSQIPLADILRELHAQFPDAAEINVAAGVRATRPGVIAVADMPADPPVLMVRLALPQALGSAEVERLRKGLRARAGLPESGDVRLDVEVIRARKVKVGSSKN